MVEPAARRIDARAVSATPPNDVADRAPLPAQGNAWRPELSRPSATSSSALDAAWSTDSGATARKDSRAPVPTAPAVPAGVGASAPAPMSASSRLARSEGAASAEAPDVSAAAAARAAASRAAELRAHSQGAAASRLDEQRLSQLHGDLVAERRRLNQPGKVSREALGASLRETETKLKKQYGGKAVDFHVVVKDGKALVKPIIG
jgi:hypothetical protein